MDGCERRIEHIVSDDHGKAVTSKTTQCSVQKLSYLPFAFSAPVKDVEFQMLCGDDDDVLLTDIDRRGLLQIQPTNDDLRATAKVHQEVRPDVRHEVSVEAQFRRGQCALTPASART